MLDNDHFFSMDLFKLPSSKSSQGTNQKMTTYKKIALSLNQNKDYTVNQNSLDLVNFDDTVQNEGNIECFEDGQQN